MVDRGEVRELFQPEVRDRPAGKVGHAHAEHERVDVAAQNDVDPARHVGAEYTASVCSGLADIVSRQKTW